MTVTIQDIADVFAARRIFPTWNSNRDGFSVIYHGYHHGVVSNNDDIIAITNVSGDFNAIDGYRHINSVIDADAMFGVQITGPESDGGLTCQRRIFLTGRSAGSIVDEIIDTFDDVNVKVISRFDGTAW